MGEGERGTKTTVLLLEAPYKGRALAGAALIDLLPLAHSSCSMLCRSSYLQCELPCHRPKLRSSLHQLPALRSSIRPVRRANAFTSQAPPSHALVVLLDALSAVVLYSQLPSNF